MRLQLEPSSYSPLFLFLCVSPLSHPAPAARSAGYEGQVHHGAPPTVGRWVTDEGAKRGRTGKKKTEEQKESEGGERCTLSPVTLPLTRSIYGDGELKGDSPWSHHWRAQYPHSREATFCLRAVQAVLLSRGSLVQHHGPQLLGRRSQHAAVRTTVTVGSLLLLLHLL